MTPKEYLISKGSVLTPHEMQAICVAMKEYTDQQTEALKKEVEYWQKDRNEINAMWTRRYSSQIENEDILRERKNGHIKVLEEEITQLKKQLKEREEENEKFKKLLIRFKEESMCSVCADEEIDELLTK